MNSGVGGGLGRVWWISSLACAIAAACGGTSAGTGAGSSDGSGSGSGDSSGSASATTTAGTTASTSAGTTATSDATTGMTTQATTGVDGSTTADDAGGCGDGPACDAPWVCAPAGYCASTTGVPQFDRVFVVIFENRSLTSVMGHAPYLDGLAEIGAHATQFNSVTHPSLPNYLAMTSGDTQGVACDCHPGAENDCSQLTCNLIASACDCPADVEHLGDQLDAVGISWREYGEGMGTPCNPDDDNAVHYATKHLPFMYYSNVFDDAPRCQEHLRDYGDFAGDLAAQTHRFSMISPDLCNDMHDNCGGNPVTHGDTWASANLATILGTPGFADGGRDVLFVVWDEQDNSVGDAPIPFIVVSPLVEPGAVTELPYDHYSLLATWEDGFGVPRLGHAADAAPITDIWR